MTTGYIFFFSSRRRHTRLTCDWSSDVCSSDLAREGVSAWTPMEAMMPDSNVAGPTVRSNDVAVIGMCGRFPGAPDLASLWSRLRAGDDMLTTFTDAELAAAGAP